MENDAESTLYDPRQWEKRWHPLRAEWVVVAGHRDTRPWRGGNVPEPPKEPPYDPTCYLCPGNERAGSDRNPDYTETYAFDNDFPPVGPGSSDLTSSHGIYRAESARGRCRVVCFHPRHDLTLARMSVNDIRSVVTRWQSEYRELSADPGINHVLIFENKGRVVGVSNPHPHCQIYGTDFIFRLIETEVRTSRDYLNEFGTTLYRAVIEQELSDELRIVTRNESMVAFVPYFARYPYEIHIGPIEPRQSVADLTDAESVDFADLLKRVLCRYDNLFKTSFPYVMTFHQAPTDGLDYPEFHFHVEFYPPLRNPVMQKYLAGPEIGGGNMLSDVPAEAKAKELRELDDVHYLEFEN
jgi:UDPglucose--hexose-1-phosphate uridylyltransferase